MDSNVTPENPTGSQPKSTPKNKAEEKIDLLVSTRLLNSVEQEDVYQLLDQIRFQPQKATIDRILKYGETKRLEKGHD